MNRSLRSLVVLAGVAVLAATSQATITFSNYGAQFSVNVSGSNQINTTPPQLANGVMGVGTVTDSGSFDINSTAGLSELDVNEVDGFAIDGTLGLEVTLYNGADLSSGVMQTLYTGVGSSAANSQVTSALMPLFTTNLFSPILTGEHLITYSAQFTGSDADAVGYLGGFAVDGYEAVPEPSAYAALGLGIIGLVARKRRSGK
jgi:hypothetical protein